MRGSGGGGERDEDGGDADDGNVETAMGALERLADVCDAVASALVKARGRAERMSAKRDEAVSWEERGSWEENAVVQLAHRILLS